MIWKMARSLKAVFDLSAAFSIRRASIKCCAICFAMSRVMEKVVVVVVVMILSGLRGSGPRFGLGEFEGGEIGGSFITSEYRLNSECQESQRDEAGKERTW